VGSIAATIAFAGTLTLVGGDTLPLLVAAVGILASILATFAVRVHEGADPEWTIVGAAPRDPGRRRPCGCEQLRGRAGRQRGYEHLLGNHGRARRRRRDRPWD